MPFLEVTLHSLLDYWRSKQEREKIKTISTLKSAWGVPVEIKHKNYAKKVRILNRFMTYGMPTIFFLFMTGFFVIGTLKLFFCTYEGV